MIHTKRVIFMILPLLFVPLVYGLSSTPDACAAPPDANYGSASASCSTDEYLQRKTCCWYLPDGETIRCQSCFVGMGNDPPTHCTEVKFEGEQPRPFAPLGNGGVLEQLQDDQPPLFGRNEAAVPPTGGIVQPFTTTTPPLFGNIPQGGGFGVLQEPETPPTFGQVAPLVQKPTSETPTTPLPTPTPPPPDFAPQVNQGGGLPTIENQENVPPGGGVTEQPEDDGQQEDSPEGAPTAGPLT
jgi:hypothetical protein